MHALTVVILNTRERQLRAKNVRCLGTAKLAGETVSFFTNNHRESPAKKRYLVWSMAPRFATWQKKKTPRSLDPRMV